jgi:hypothetical protein
MPDAPTQWHLIRFAAHFHAGVARSYRTSCNCRIETDSTSNRAISGGCICQGCEHYPGPGQAHWLAGNRLPGAPGNSLHPDPIPTALSATNRSPSTALNGKCTSTLPGVANALIQKQPLQSVSAVNEPGCSGNRHPGYFSHGRCPWMIIGESPR